ncbi:RDD family protein [Streptomyces sp. NPDC045431]|uniref:RDD family protein n=1 Tax=Streptomyces sp. NPDC045431 TaxID=3155613 RepID=UPI0033F22BF0
MATPPGDGGNVPLAGYYPDPSIPGYIRYWNGAAWVPGTSRPAPAEGEAVPAPPASAVPASPAPKPAPAPSVEETGPVFFDEEEAAEEAAAKSEPASAWQADAARQTGFGGDRDRRVSWGAESAQAQPQGAAADPRVPAGTDPTGGALPGVRKVEPRSDGTVTIRAQKPAPATAPAPVPAQERPADGTMTIRALGKDAPRTPQVPAQHQPQAQPAPQAAQAPQAQAQVPQPAPAPAPAPPVAHGAGGGSASWAQQVHQLAQPPQAAHQQHQQQPLQSGPRQESQQEPPVVPWKPPVEDPFLRAARAQAAARPAPLGKRLAARLIDTVVLGAAVGAVGVPLVSKALDHIDGKIQQAKQSGETVTVWLLDSTTSTYFGITLAALLVLGVLYEALPTAKWGRTLGKRVCGLEVRDIESHAPPAFGAALRRWLVYSVPGLLVIGIVGVLWALIDRPWRQAWHDKAAHTFVAGQGG